MSATRMMTCATRAVEHLLDSAQQIAARRGLSLRLRNCGSIKLPSHGRAADRDAGLRSAHGGFSIIRMHSGAGHDAMMLAEQMPAAMLFLRSPGASAIIRDESVLEADVEAALATGLRFLDQLERAHG